MRYPISIFLAAVLLSGHVLAEQVTWDRAGVLLEEYCFTCHDADTAKGDIILDGIFDTNGKVKDYKLWESALHSVKDGEMPPKKKQTQPTDDERTELATWIQEALVRSSKENAGDPGIVTMRRLTNAEYRHTLRELTGKWKDYSKGFAADGGGGEGFSNTGDVLFVSPEQMEKYLKRAREVAAFASILPGTGIQFEDEEVGIRGPGLLVSQTEMVLQNWYRKQTADLFPKDGVDLRERDYVIACWRWKHRAVTKAESLDKLADQAGLDHAFLKNWWYIFTQPQPESRYLKLTTNVFASMPGPDPLQPGVVPEAVVRKALKIQSDRRAWLTPGNGDWSHPQRMQQDVDGIVERTIRLDIAGEEMVHLVVTALDDGNAGDLVHWRELNFQYQDGNWDSLFGWMRRRAEEETDEAAKNFYYSHLGVEKVHPLGKELPAETFSVQAPSIVSFPIPKHVKLFGAVAKLEGDAPDRDLASVQWTVLKGKRPQWLPPILPGVVTVWHRLTEVHKKLDQEFNVMKQCFPAGYEKQMEQTSWNIYRWGNKPQGPYFFTDEQLFARVPRHEKEWAQRKRKDLDFVGNKNMPESYQQDWDYRVLNHLRQFADRAWRKPLNDSEFRLLQSIYHEARSRDMDRESAGREVLVSILVSPRFLFRIEGGANGKESVLSQHEYAARLSYFLWSCPPDEALIKSANEGKLLSQDWKVVCDHVDRMLANYRTMAMAQEFGGQWLGFHNLYSLKNIDRKTFPEFNHELRHLMYEESWRFIAKIIQDRRPVIDITQARYTFLNEPLARHYGIPGVQGKEFRLVDVASHRRGGIFGMAGFHAKTSYPVRTSPVLRGDWILRDVLGRPTPPPPANIPELDEGEGETPLTLRAQLQKHRQDAACASCHDKIDPLGFALEKFDPIGRFRDTDKQGRPIDDRGETSDGMVMQGIDGLRKYLKQEEDQFLHHFCTKLVGYALGREVRASDQLLIKDMIANMRKWDYTFDAAVKPLVLSRQFQRRRNQK